MRGADCWTDHRLLIARVKLHIKKPTRKNGSKVPKKYCVARLKEEETADTFRESVASQLPDIDDTNWDSLKKALLNSAETILLVISSITTKTGLMRTTQKYANC